MILTILIFIVVLGLLVFVHELGHFLTARMFKIKAEEFGFGFPPRMCGWRKIGGKWKFFWGNQPIEAIESEDTVFSLNWLPLGGFVKIKGEDGVVKDPDSFASKKPWQRLIVLSAGVLMNFFLAMVLISAAFMLGAPQVVDGQAAGAVVDSQQVQVLQVMPETPAATAGLQTGDVIVAIDGESISNDKQVVALIREKSGEEVLLTISRFGDERAVSMIPDDDQGVGRIGVSLVTTGLVKYPWYQAIWLGITSTFLLTWQIIVGFGMLIKGLFVGMPPGMDVAGPVGIAVMTGQVARLGLVYLLQFAALLSINLAIINFIPFPALDGGRALFVVIEKLRRRPIDRQVEQIVHAVGFFILIGLIIVVTGRDIWKFKAAFLGLFQTFIG